MMRFEWTATIFALVLSAIPGMATAQQDLATAFGMREYVEQASLSPDGTKIAFVQSMDGQASSVMLLDLTEARPAPRGIVQASGDPERLSGCRWVSNSRLVCTIYGLTRVGGDLSYTSRILAVDADGRQQKVLPMPRGFGLSLFGGAVIDWNSGTDGHVLMMRDRLPTAETGSRLGDRRSGLAVDLVDTRTMRARAKEAPNEEASEYITDGQGNLRIMGRSMVDGGSGMLTGERRYSFRMAGERQWRPLSTVMPDRAGFDPYGVDADRNIAYGLKRKDGRMAAYSVALDGSGAEKLIFAHPEVDVAGFARIGRQGRIVGVTYVTDVRQVNYFDPALDKLAKSLATALPGKPLIRFVDSSEDEDIMLLWAGADNDPGRYYLFNRTDRKLEPLMEDRPPLADVKLATMKPIRYPAADGTMIPGYLTLPSGGQASGLSALVMPHGGPGARDEWGFDWLAQYFASQGFAVLQPNFRGSTGYGDEWFQKNGFQSWQIAVGDVNDAGRWLVREGIADPAKLGIFGWSYGGYAALQSAVVDPELFRAIVAVAPVTDLQRLRDSRQNWTNYRLTRDFIGDGPHLAAGSPSRHAHRISAPVLMFHGDMDRNVDIAQGRLMQSRLTDAGRKTELIVYPGLDHYLEDSSARADMLRRSATFLKGAMGE